MQSARENIDLLTGALQTFSRTTVGLQFAYKALERKIAALNVELEEANRNLSRSLVEASTLKDHLNSILESMTNGVIVIDPCGRITLFNKAAGEITGYRDKEVLGFLSVADHVREGAAATIGRLKKLGLRKVGILSGDHEQSVRLVGKSVGIDHLWSGLKPDDKLEAIRDMREKNARIIFVGDGINDAPALAISDTGIAMGARGTEVALETADIALMGDDISKLPFLISLGRRMLFVIKCNIAFVLLFNCIAVLASGTGLLTPIMGAVVHNIGSVLVVLSSASIGLFQGDG